MNDPYAKARANSMANPGGGWYSASGKASAPNVPQMGSYSGGDGSGGASVIARLKSQGRLPQQGQGGGQELSAGGGGGGGRFGFNGGQGGQAQSGANYQGQSQGAQMAGPYNVSRIRDLAGQVNQRFGGQGSVQSMNANQRMGGAYNQNLNDRFQQSQTQSAAGGGYQSMGSPMGGGGGGGYQSMGSAFQGAQSPSYPTLGQSMNPFMNAAMRRRGAW
jgi:hypothetical protein